ncbi:hypothetical protein KQI89_13850 [Clostridium sp. MSJ-4]|uniref:Uncharacterized protein n=1 Tax=Clostridium simiarum TaxID=2841506 RepID=A0ABS6F2V4_9CLOT|nr:MULTISPECIES: hypothetical protein [Clostridium]MBU5592832.1 hypothetical protein [Clostridium simiarum]
MVAFKTMWEDVNDLLSRGEKFNINIVETFNCGFTVEDNGNTTFITKDDFVDFWCNMLYFNEIPKSKIINDERSKSKYVYEIIKKLPYINEKSEVLTLLK